LYKEGDGVAAVKLLNTYNADDSRNPFLLLNYDSVQ
jgi:hypothetical protein